MSEEIFDIKRFDQYREDNRLEVKKCEGGLPASLWESYSAMANCYGGVIIIGVGERNDGSFYTTGLQDAAGLKKVFWDTINSRSKVNINLLMDEDVKTYELNGDVILVINVPRARRDQRPVYINNDIWNGTYRRNWEGDYHCTKSEIRSMLRDEPEDTMDMIVLEDYTLKELSDETVQAYRNYFSAVKPGHVWENLPKEEFVEKIGAAGRLKNGELRPTVAGLLMFGEEYRIVSYFPTYFLDYREVLDPTIRWTDRIQSSSGEWSGNLFDFFFRVYNRLSRDLPKPFVLNGLSRVEDTPTHKAVREALANCIVNADFYLPRGLVILKEQDKIVMQNPGSIRTGKNQMLRGGISDPRNSAILKMLNLLSIGERAGSGVPNIFSVWENNKWDAPVIEEQYGPDRTILTLPLSGKIAKKTSEENKQRKQAKKTSEENEQSLQAKISSEVSKRSKTIEHENIIIEMLQKNGSMKVREMSQILNLSEQRIRAIISKMDEIEAVGNTNNRKYIIRNGDAK